MKKAQISIFIIIIIILGIIVFLSLSLENKADKTSNIDTNSIKEFVNKCHENTLRDAIKYVSEHGGMYKDTRYNRTYGMIEDTLIYTNETNITKKYIARSISRYISDNLRFCIGDFSSFKDYRFEYDIPRLDVMISDNSVESHMKSPIIIKYNNIESKLVDFTSRKESNIGILFEISQRIINDYYKYNGTCISCIIRYNKKYNIKTDIEKENKIFILSKDNDIFRFKIE